VLLSAGFEPVTLGVRVKWLNQWATEEPVYSHSPGLCNSAELLQYLTNNGSKIFFYSRLNLKIVAIFGIMEKFRNF